MCVRVIDCVYVSTISRLDFGSALTVLYLFFVDFLKNSPFSHIKMCRTKRFKSPTILKCVSSTD